MQKLVYTALAIVTLLFLASCDDGTVDGGPVDNPSDNPTYHPIIPLNIGNIWVYELVDYDDQGSQIGEPDSYTMQVLRDTTIDNIAGVITRARNDESFVTNKSDGFYMYGEDSDTRIEKLYKYPIIKGDSYIRATGEAVLVEEVKKKITVPAGTFDCVVFKVNYQDNENYELNYFAKGVGLIKSENWSKNAQNVYIKTSSEELISKNF